MLYNNAGMRKAGDVNKQKNQPGIQNKGIIITVISFIIVSSAGLWIVHKISNKHAEKDVTGQQYEPVFKKEGRLAFVKKNGNDTLTVINIEMADGEEERTRGLMLRHSMPDSNGMLFIFEEERPLSFWMKNTYIPLDIIFASKTGEIVAIQHNTIPLSEAPVPSGQPARYAIEVNAWFCVDHGINTGDKIEFSMIK